MTKNYMVTAKRGDTLKQFNREAVKWRTFFWENDVHKWTLGAEQGKRGYKHWQVRFRISIDSIDVVRDMVQKMFEGAHIEECSDTWTYECKERMHWTSEDRPETLQTRFGQLKENQKQAIERLKDQNDRQIDVWYDPKGNSGKSWLVNHLYETAQAHYTPPYLSNVKEIVQTVASLYLNVGWRDILVIDIPRSWKWSKELYTAIEAIKDGLIMETRYHPQPVNIRGVKVLVLCNTLPKLDALSIDRWRINGETPALS